MTLNVIKWTSKQMLLLILLVKEHEESKGNKCILLIPVQAKMLLTNIGLCSEKDFVLESDFEAEMPGSGLVFCISSFLNYGYFIHI
ncbi:MAG: hypothetical protein ACI83B_003632 [Sediminicola sp.]|jgi:hypothetical protein